MEGVMRRLLILVAAAAAMLVVVPPAFSDTILYTLSPDASFTFDSEVITLSGSFIYDNTSNTVVFSDDITIGSPYNVTLTGNSGGLSCTYPIDPSGPLCTISAEQSGDVLDLGFASGLGSSYDALEATAYSTFSPAIPSYYFITSETGSVSGIEIQSPLQPSVTLFATGLGLLAFMGYWSRKPNAAAIVAA
jgi:hypothetical protein